LLSPNNYLGIISYIDIDRIECDYVVKRKAPLGYDDAILEPLCALRSIVWKSVLKNFQQVLKTDSYIELCHTTLKENEESLEEAEYSNFESWGDQVGILLLRTVLDELRSIPYEFISLKASNATTFSRLKMS